MTARDTPLVSVVLPVHDGARYLAAAIQSILDQTWRHFELIILDDGSTDGSAAVAASFVDPRIVLVRNESNLGLVRTLNRGLDLARGELVARMDADDIAAPARLERQVQRMRDDPALAVLGTDIAYIDPGGRPLGRPRNVPCGATLVRWRLLRGTCLYHPTVMLRRAALGAERYAEGCAHAEDYELWLRLARTQRLDNLGEVLLRHRRYEQSVSVRHRADQLAAAAHALCAHARQVYGLELTAGQARALLDPRSWLDPAQADSDSPIPVTLELERRFLAQEAAITAGERRAVSRDVAFVCWKLAALSIVHWRHGAVPGRRLAALAACASVLARRPRAAIAALNPAA